MTDMEAKDPPDKEVMSHSQPTITPIQQMISSCSGAFLTSLFVTPLDVIKIRLQAQAKPFHKGQCFLYCNGLMDHICACLNGHDGKAWYKVPLPGRFTGTFDAFIKITRYEGIRSLWSGLPPTLVMAVPATVIYFTTYDQLKVVFGYQEGSSHNLFVPPVAGSIARVFAVSVISPLELVRTKMQSTKLSYREVTRAVQSAVSVGGPRVLWAGLGPTLFRDVPFSAFYWFCYEMMKAQITSKTGESDIRLSQSFACGASAGTFAGVVTLPFDVIKTHRQIELGESALTDRKATKSMWKLLHTVYKQRGISGLFAGIVPRVTKVAPACAIMVSTYEYGKSFFRSKNAAKKEIVF